MLSAPCDRRDRDRQPPICFRASFNRFEPINLSQAWSLILSAGRDDGLLGLKAATGWFISLAFITSLVLVALEKFDFGTL